MKKIRTAAEELYNKFKDQIWFQTIGIAEPDTLYVYSTLRVPKSVQQFKQYKSFHVVWQHVGIIKPL